MRKKATLLIKNIHNIYTMTEYKEQCVLFQNGFLALHHDEILDLGTHSYLSYIDKDTRVIDGTNHIAIPAFIEADAYMNKEERVGLREQNEYFMRYMLNGTLTIRCTQRIQNDLLHNYHYEIIQENRVCDAYPMLRVVNHMKQKEHIEIKQQCISCYDKTISLQNQMMAAQLLAMKDEIDAYELLKSLTIYPAACLNRKDIGVLEKGKQANILLLSTENLHAFFYSLDQNKISQIIHKGVRIYPNLLI